MSDESTRVEQDFAVWEANRDIECDTANCPNPAEFITTTHPTGIRHGNRFRCRRCLAMIHHQNAMTIRHVGAIRCAVCNVIFRDINQFMTQEKL